MHTKTIKYKDLEENVIEETFYFNLSKPELVTLAASRDGGMDKYLERIIKARKNSEILKAFREIIEMSIGEKNPNGKTFDKNDTIRDNFFQSNAWEELFMELFTDEGKFAAFIEALMPKDMLAEIKAEQAKMDKSTSEYPPPPGSAEPSVPEWITSGAIPTADQLRGATQEQINIATRRKILAAEAEANLTQ